MTVKSFIKKTVKTIFPYAVVLAKKIRNKKSLLFFQKNKKSVDTIAELLADERSKEVYLGVINARCGLGEFSDFYTKQTQYFENEFFEYSKDEFLLDCGAYTGDTIDEFIKFVPDYKGIISFEPTPAIFEMLKKKHGDNPKIKLINKGVWGEVSKLTFVMGSNTDDDHFGAGNAISNKANSNTTIDVTSIDALNLQEKVTFIKMDIEGAELEALKGSTGTILRDKPRLAVCIYHSNNDMIRIAEYIHEIMPEYKLYVRHHWLNDWETVLYACI